MDKFKLVQQTILNEIKSKNEGKKLVEVLAQELNLSSDSAYRRIRNEKMFTLDEVLILSKRYNISIDKFTNVSTSDVIPFSFQFHDEEYNFSDYLLSILKNFDLIESQKATLYYSAKDVPIFYHMGFEYLGKFKVLYWLKTMLSQKQYQQIDFETFNEFEHFKPLCKKINQQYFRLNSVEIWNYETSHSVAAQIEYYYNLSFISKQNAVLVLQDYLMLIDQIKSNAEHSQKVLPTNQANAEEENFKLFYNEVFAADNSILAISNDLKAAFLPHINLKYMTTTDSGYCDYMENVFNLVMKKSTLISGVNERDRNIFFNYNSKRIQALLDKIKADNKEDINV